MSGASAGLVCGAGAVVCVPALAVAAWFGVDYVVAKGGEMLNRAEFEAGIVADFMLAKTELKTTLSREYNATIDEISTQILK